MLARATTDWHWTVINEDFKQRKFIFSNAGDADKSNYQFFHRAQFTSDLR